MTRKPARRAAPAHKNLPFDVPPQIDRALKTAADKVGAVRAETRNVAAKVETKVRAAATNVRKTGETIAKDPKHFVEDVVRTAKSDIDKVRADVSREAGRIADEVARRVTAVVEPALESALHRLNVPTQKDLKTLITKVDGLSRKMDQLHPATPRPRKRKTA
ncbi:MAG: phasin family protein [Holophagales bacterium]|nr:phasin family protein [Holophagales bacterium]